MGHLIRQSHIAKTLRDRGNDITFFIPDYLPAQVWLDQYELSHQTSSNVEKITGDLIILDIQNTTKAFIKKLKQHKKPVVSFEDLGAGRNDVDLLIDCNLDEEKSSGLTALFGHNYVVLAEKFANYHSKMREFKKPIQSVLVTFGATDLHSMTSKFAKKILLSLPSISITILAGPGSKNISALKDLSYKNKQVKLLESTSEMAQTLFIHDAVFCSGGVTLHEAMAVGTPAFVINQVSHQIATSNQAEKQGAAINLGMSDTWDENCLLEILQSNPKTLEKMSRAGKSLIDGKGLKRVANAIEHLSKSGE
jgi:spore coat polysaccharide biosynthesis predicted glycosyltransferase SpsG